MLEQVAEGFALFLTFQNVFLVIFGVTIGIIIGAIPGLTPSMAIALALPISFVLPVVPSLAFLMGVYKGGVYGGSISAILVRSPGTPEAAATMFDGYPLAQQGKAGKALKMAVYASVMGDTFSDLVLIFSAGALATLALKAGPVEYFSLLLLSLTIIGSASGKNILKGLITAVLGLMMGFVGVDPLQGTERFVFGSMELSAGLGFLPLLIGLFAVSEVIVQAEKKVVESSRETSTSLKKSDDPADNRVSWVEMKGCLKTIFRSSVIGTVIGAMPGVGATAAAFLGYGAAQRASKSPEKFGTGCLEGVAAAEAANNAVCGSNLIPLLTLGVPGSLTAAILVGAFLIQGLPIGPLIFEHHGPVIYGLYISLLFANFVNFTVAHVMIRIALKVIYVSKDTLFPIIMITCVIGSFAWNNTLFDVKIMFIFGVIGYFMRKLEFPVTPFLIAFILGPMAEVALREAMVIHKGDVTVFVTHPISLVCLILTVLSVVLISYRQIRGT
ncbi:MAG: tripartite tricarboxylate transporter permease [Deltaproteobacteria bacterium]|nr:tripartite tricarboxylate transporter permease [Deltaproteobacteria bacterium]